jgi:phospholipase C
MIVRRPILWSSAVVAILVALAGGAAIAAPIHPSNAMAAERMSLPTITPPLAQIPLPRRKSSQKIQHVVIILQENRSFDDLFQGYPKADTQSYGYDSNGNKITLQPVGLESGYDLEHDIYSYFEDCNGTGSLPGTDCQMNGFNNEPTGCGSCSNPQYGYVPHSETATYFSMAHKYVLADRMFTSHIDDSFISHQYIIAAQANGTAYFPSSSWGCEGGTNDTIATLSQSRQVGNPHIQVCWDINTLGDELDAAGLSWRFYASSVNGDGGIWSAYQAIRHIYQGPDWSKDVISPQTQIFTDIKNGTLSNVTWVTPTCATSDHAGCGSNKGPAWVASVVNAVGQSQFWNTTAIFVMWDEWGGWYDHVAPPFEDYDGLGFRVPLLIISPYAKKNYVSHVQYEHGSLLRFAEDEFGLAQLSAADKRANDPATDAFDFKRKPRKFEPFATQFDANYFIHAPPDHRAPDSE